MSLVAVVGDATTTTALALSAAWPVTSVEPPPGSAATARPGSRDAAHDVFVIEADPAGGSMAAWLDVPASPSLSTVVTRVGEGGWSVVDGLARATPWGVRLIPAPVRSIEAVRAVAEADRQLFGLLAGPDRPVSIVDAGRVVPAMGPPPVLRRADVAVVVHRQARASARAAAVRIERLAELVDLSLAAAAAVVVAVIGDTPFEIAEIRDFLSREHDVEPSGRDHRATSVPPVVELADDPLAAAAIAGRSGVPARRFARLPLSRSMTYLAAATEALLTSTRTAGAWTVAT